MLLDLVQGIEWLSGLFVRCTIQKGKELMVGQWLQPLPKPHECGFKKSGVRQNGRGVWSHVYSIQDMSKALKHYIVYSGSSGWWHSENLSVQEWVNKIDQNMNSLCQLGRGAHIRYSANLVVCAKVGGSGAIPPVLSNSTTCTSPQILIDTVKGVTINIVTSPGYDRANVNARFKGEIWVMHRKLWVVAVIWQFRIQGAPDRERGWTAPWWAMQLSKSHPGPLRPFGVSHADGGA